MLAICLQKIGETEIKRIIRLNLTIKSLILCGLYKMTSMDISSGSNRSNYVTATKTLKTEGFSD